jgi:hypothetical protein
LYFLTGTFDHYLAINCSNKWIKIPEQVLNTTWDLVKRSSN